MNENIHDLSRLAEAAFRATASTVIVRAKQTGTPVIVWQDGQIKEIRGDELDALEQSLRDQNSGIQQDGFKIPPGKRT